MTGDAPSERRADTPYDRPTAAELVAAVREFLENDVMRATEGRVAFHARVAANVCALVERELAQSDEARDGARAALTPLLDPPPGPDVTIHAIETRLAAAIRTGTIPARDPAVLAAVRARVRTKLDVAHPGYAQE